MSKRDINIAITAASYSGNKGAAAMLQSSIKQLYAKYGSRLNIKLMSVYPDSDREQVPFDFVDVVPTKPERLLFIAFPLAVLYKGLGWIPGMKKLIGKNKIIKAYRDTDLVIDEAGISFVDSRGFVMNTYAFVTMAVPKLIGVPIVKYSQAMGSFESFFNRIYAKMILPNMELICARGDITLDNLKGIGVSENVKLCADGAFTMEDTEESRLAVDERTNADSFYDGDVVGVSLSSVVDKKCRKMKIDYLGEMIKFIDYLTERGYKVLLIANAARINSEKPRNNDLMVCDYVYSKVSDKENVRWYHEEMDAEVIREYIGRCRFLVASRFHAMIGALQRKVPVLLVGWSHKYKEVLDMFGLGSYAADYADLGKGEGKALLETEFERLETDEDEIRRLIDEHYDDVMESSYRNIFEISKVVDRVTTPGCYKCKTARGCEEKYNADRCQSGKGLKKGNGSALERTRLGNIKRFPDIDRPEKYMGEFIECRRGYAADPEIRKNAASGGVVTALLTGLLKAGEIDGAFVCRTAVKDGELSYETMIATDEETLKSCSSSIYMSMPLLKDLDKIRKFDGKVAVVLIPCLMRAFNAILKHDKELAEKVVLKLGLFCSGNHSREATLLSLKKAGVSLEDAERMYYRRGAWRGKSSVIYKDGSEKTFSYTKTLCAFKNAYFFEEKSCMLCQDHFASGADISFGDIWLKKMKKEPVKCTGYIIRTPEGKRMYDIAVKAGAVVERHMSVNDCLAGQKRALSFKFACAKAKEAFFAKQGKNISIDTSDRCKWNHKLAFYLAEKNRLYSEEKPDKLAKKPMSLIYYYMCFIRVLLSL